MRVCILFVCLGLLGLAKDVTPEDSAVRFHQARASSRPGDGEALRLLAGALIKRAEATGSTADYDEAWRVLEDAQRVEPGELSTTLKQAQVLLSRHRFVLASSLLQKALKRHPANTDVLALAGDARLELGDLEGAEKLFTRLTEMSKRFPSFSRMSAVAEAKGNLDEAARWMQTALATARRMGESTETIGWARAVLGEIYLKQGRSADARAEYTAGLREAPEHPLLMEHLAELERAEGNDDASIVLYRRILSLGRPDPENKLRLSEILVKTGNTEEGSKIRAEARAFLKAAVEAGNEGYIRPLARIYLEERNFQAAADLAFWDVGLRPTVESKELLDSILAQATAAGSPINSFVRR
jgi:tetratricopeptide (TPR) repeat protein